MLKLYDNERSGNCYKVRLLLAQLGRAYERIPVDVVDKKNRPAGLRAGNPLGKVPLIVLEDGRMLPESNAILWHFAQGTRFLPDDTFERTQVLRWLFFEQNAHEPNIASVRYLVSIARQADRHVEVIEHKRQGGEAALRALERHLADEPFVVGKRYSIADIALYAYTHVADEGGFDLERLPAIRSWLGRVREQPGHVPITGQV